jgi:hypothetical protein
VFCSVCTVTCGESAKTQGPNFYNPHLLKLAESLGVAGTVDNHSRANTSPFGKAQSRLSAGMLQVFDRELLHTDLVRGLDTVEKPIFGLHRVELVCRVVGSGSRV